MTQVIQHVPLKAEQYKEGSGVHPVVRYMESFQQDFLVDLAFVPLESK